MPWTTKDVDEHMKGLSPAEKATWVEAANEALEGCTGDDCEAAAIKQANAVIAKVREALTPEEDDFVEAATFKAMLQSLLRSARGVASHKNVPKAVKSKLSDLTGLLRKTYASMTDSDPALGAADVSEGIGGASQPIEFVETGGELLEVADE